MKKEEIQEKCELCGLISLFLMSLLAVAPAARAGEIMYTLTRLVLVEMK